jgi:hypothetical protein
MKTNLIRAAGLMLLICAFQFSFAGFTGGSIMGRVVDPETKEPVAFATVVVESEGTQKIYNTNEEGYYYASNIPSGVYSVTVTLMSRTVKVIDIRVSNDESRVVDVEFSQTVQLGGDGGVVIVEYKIPLIDPIDVQNGTLDRGTIAHMPITKVSDAGETQSGTVKIGGEYYVHGARSGGLAYYIDGGKVMGSPDIPLCGLQSYRMYNGFIPANYGDALGGVVVIETRNYFSEAHD